MNEMSRKLIIQESNARKALLDALESGSTWRMGKCIRDLADEAHCNAR